MGKKGHPGPRATTNVVPFQGSAAKRKVKPWSLQSWSELLAFFFCLAFLPSGPCTPSLLLCSIPNHYESIKYADLFKHSPGTSPNSTLTPSSVSLPLKVLVSALSLLLTVMMRIKKEILSRRGTSQLPFAIIVGFHSHTTGASGSLEKALGPDSSRVSFL